MRGVSSSIVQLHSEAHCVAGPSQPSGESVLTSQTRGRRALRRPHLMQADRHADFLNGAWAPAAGQHIHPSPTWCKVLLHASQVFAPQESHIPSTTRDHLAALVRFHVREGERIASASRQRCFAAEHPFHPWQSEWMERSDEWSSAVRHTSRAARHMVHRCQTEIPRGQTHTPARQANAQPRKVFAQCVQAFAHPRQPLCQRSRADRHSARTNSPLLRDGVSPCDRRSPARVRCSFTWSQANVDPLSSGPSTTPRRVPPSCRRVLHCCEMAAHPPQTRRRSVQAFAQSPQTFARSRKVIPTLRQTDAQ